MQEIVKVNNLCKNFFTKEGELEVLKNISFTLNQGEFISLLGPSGSGKSTSDDVYKIIKNEGKSAILVTHDISEAICYKVQPLIKMV